MEKEHQRKLMLEKENNVKGAETVKLLYSRLHARYMYINAAMLEYDLTKDPH